MRSSYPWSRTLIAGFVGGVALIAGLIIFFGPAQSILANPEYQSAKMIAVFFELEPLPRSGTQPLALAVGLLLIGVLHGAVYAWVAPALPGVGWRKGFAYGLVLWCLMIVWFEFFMLWNVLHEPLPLILLEGALWMLTLQLEGTAIAAVYRYRDAPAHVQAAS